VDTDWSVKSLEAFYQATADVLAASENQLEAIQSRLGAQLAELEQECSRLHLHIEELLLEHPQENHELERLRQAEDRLTQALTQGQLLSRQLRDFVQLLRLARHQFHERGVLPGNDIAQQLAVRQAMIHAQEEERRRLAREIHDGPAQVLANAILSVQFAARVLARTEDGGKGAVLEELERIERLLREGLSETRRFMIELQPVLLHQQGLLPALRHYLETFQRLFQGELVVHLPETLPPLTPDQELTVFRVVQEALHNAQRHARARRIMLTLSATSADIVLEVADDGQGFRPSAVTTTSSGGFGLKGMRERAEVVGGEVTIWSEPGAGTRITLRLPLTPQLAEYHAVEGQTAG